MAKDYTGWKDKIGNGPKLVFDWPLTFRYRGQFDYDGLMNLIRSYYAKVKIDKLDEPQLKYRMGGGKAEVEFKFTGEMKATGYTKIVLNVSGHVWDAQPGKISNGRVELKIRASYQHDYGKGFNEKNSIHRWMMKKIYYPNVGKGMSVGDMKSEGKKNAEKISNDLLTEIKKFIGVECT